MQTDRLSSGDLIRPITPADDAQIAQIIREDLRQFHLDIPGTAYFDPELDHLSLYYGAAPERRTYFIAADRDGQVLGGAGVAEFSGLPCCAELQKLYLSDAARGRGLGRRLMQAVQDHARSLGYQQLYLETHSDLKAAIGLYEKLGFRRIDRLPGSPHSTMDRFYLKAL